jgi:hypothetical protein
MTAIPAATGLAAKYERARTNSRETRKRIGFGSAATVEVATVEGETVEDETVEDETVFSASVSGSVCLERLKMGGMERAFRLIG